MFHLKLGICLSAVFVCVPAAPAPARYIQKQVGKSNYRADIQNIKFVMTDAIEAIELAVGLVGMRALTQSKNGYTRPGESPYHVDLGKSEVPVSKYGMEDFTKLFSDPPSSTVKKDLKAEVTLEERSDEKPAEVIKEKETIVQKEEATTTATKEDPKVEKKEDKIQNLTPPKKDEMKTEVKKNEKYKKPELVEKKTINTLKKEETTPVKKVEKQTTLKPTTTNHPSTTEKVKTTTISTKINEPSTEKASSTTTPLPTTEAASDKKEDKVPSESRELLLVGEGIEQCGPDGHRDATGMCVYLSKKQ